MRNHNSLTTFNHDRNPFWTLQEEVNSLFDDFFQMRPSSNNKNQKKWAPSIEVSEKDNEYIVCADIPGMKKEDINLTLSENSLIISGERHSESKDDSSGNHYSEMSYGSFYRTIPFQHEVDSEKVSASMNNGLLKINIGKSETTKEKSRRIDIQ